MTRVNFKRSPRKDPTVIFQSGRKEVGDREPRFGIVFLPGGRRSTPSWTPAPPGNGTGVPPGLEMAPVYPGPSYGSAYAVAVFSTQGQRGVGGSGAGRQAKF